MLKTLLMIINKLTNIDSSNTIDRSIVMNFDLLKNEQIFTYRILSKIYLNFHNINKTGLLFVDFSLSNRHLETIVIKIENGQFSDYNLYYKLSKLYFYLLEIED